LAKDDLITSAVGRFIRLGGLMGRVGASVIGSKAVNLVAPADSKEARTTDNLVKNAVRIVETLGELKGAAMKVGQMMSLHEALLPSEVVAVLRALQKEAPSVPFEVMEFEIKGELENFDDIFESLEPEAFAAASIGQVHRGVLKDGRKVAVKIQYPLIEEIIRADLKNLRTIFKTLVSMFSDTDFDPIWREVRDRLLEELDYVHEAKSTKRMARLHADIPEIIIPRVVEEASTKRVLTMEFVEGIPPDDACSDEYDQDLKDRWGRALFDFQFRGLVEHRLLHADPNLSNFAFRDDGRIVVYDFGCVKKIPKEIAAGYADILHAALEGRISDIPTVLAGMGVHREDGAPLENELTDPYLELFAVILRESPPYTFGEDEDLYDKLFEMGLANWTEAKDIVFPRHIIFIDRSLGGHFGNLSRLAATGPWRELALNFINAFNTGRKPNE
jgi:predicted unusual protein kinase regulating ubiquinone biosynthesis (AarF/ABC1/UbiB family)